MSHGSAGRLTRADHLAIVGFLADTRELELDTPYAPAYVRHLASLFEDASAIYRENDLGHRRSTVLVDADGSVQDGREELYWTVGPCPITGHRQQTADLTAVRLSDLVGRRRYRESPIYREYYAPAGVGHMLDIGLPARTGWQRTVLFWREIGDPDFSERDRSVLEALRPHLRAREARAALLRSLGDEAGLDVDAIPGLGTSLTLREREIVFLASQGKTNSRIATELWITPGTVKKHLELVYDKLGVRSRAAAACRLEARAWSARDHPGPRRQRPSGLDRGRSPVDAGPASAVSMPASKVAPDLAPSASEEAEEVPGRFEVVAARGERAGDDGVGVA